MISNKHYHGIAFYGVINSRIVNNTVLVNPLFPPGSYSGIPWITIGEHGGNPQPDGTPWPRSSGNLIRNNIVSYGIVASASVGTKDFNLTVYPDSTYSIYNTYFTNYSGFDFSLNATSPAIGTGSATRVRRPSIS